MIMPRLSMCYTWNIGGALAYIYTHIPIYVYTLVYVNSCIDTLLLLDGRDFQ